VTEDRPAAGVFHLHQALPRIVHKLPAIFVGRCLALYAVIHFVSPEVVPEPSFSCCFLNKGSRPLQLFSPAADAAPAGAAADSAKAPGR
jgi:hypothetical protein